jgi:hypothetical protein
LQKFCTFVDWFEIILGFWGVGSLIGKIKNKLKKYFNNNTNYEIKRTDIK